MDIMMASQTNPNNGNGEDLTTLEAEITELQRENARVESQMMRLKSDINVMESHLTHGERVRKFRSVDDKKGFKKKKLNFFFRGLLTSLSPLNLNPFEGKIITNMLPTTGLQFSTHNLLSHGARLLCSVGL